MSKEQKPDIENLKKQIHKILVDEGAADLENVIFKIAGPESGWDQKIKNPTGSAFGLWQFVKDTREDLAKKDSRLKGIGNNSNFGLKEQVIAMVNFTRENHKDLGNNKSEFGKDFRITDDVTYGAHFAGRGAAKEIYSDLSGKKLISSIFSPDAMRQNADVHLRYENGTRLDLKNFTTTDFKIWTNRKMGQPDGYETMTLEARAKYNKEHNIPEDAPTAFGAMQMFVDIVMKISASIGSFIGGIFSGNTPNGSNLPTPETPATNVASVKTPVKTV
jgi:hypothetical protein